MSPRTLRRRRQEYCVGVQSYDSISDADLDITVGKILETIPQAGRNLVSGSLQSRGIEEFVGQWNNHPLTSECNYSPLQLWVRDMITLRNSGYSAVEAVISGQQTFEDYGVEEVETNNEEAEIETSNMVVVPEITLMLNDSVVSDMQEIIHSARNYPNGVTTYINVARYLTNVLQ